MLTVKEIDDLLEDGPAIISNGAWQKLCAQAKEAVSLQQAEQGREDGEEGTDSVGDWQCRGFGNDWITFPDRRAAEKYQEQTGAIARYRRFYPATRKADR